MTVPRIIPLILPPDLDAQVCLLAGRAGVPVTDVIAEAVRDGIKVYLADHKNVSRETIPAGRAA